MFILYNLRQLERAIARCHAYRPRVGFVHFGLYTVTGQHGTDYVVACYRDEQGRRVLDCTCPTRDGVACKHAAAALPLHVYLAASRQRAEERHKLAHMAKV
jgi:hypothetical protein